MSTAGEELPLTVEAGTEFVLRQLPRPSTHTERLVSAVVEGGVLNLSGIAEPERSKQWLTGLNDLAQTWRDAEEEFDREDATSEDSAPESERVDAIYKHFLNRFCPRPPFC